MHNEDVSTVSKVYPETIDNMNQYIESMRKVNKVLKYWYLVIRKLQDLLEKVSLKSDLVHIFRKYLSLLKLSGFS